MIPKGDITVTTHKNVSPEDWIKTQSLVLRVGHAGGLYHDKGQSQMQPLEFCLISTREEKT